MRNNVKGALRRRGPLCSTWRLNYAPWDTRSCDVCDASGWGNLRDVTSVLVACGRDLILGEPPAIICLGMARQSETSTPG